MPNSQNSRVSSLTPAARPQLDDIRSWFASPLGQRVLSTEEAMLDQLLPGMFGYHLAQFSVQQRELFGSSMIQNKFVVDMDLQATRESTGLVSSPSQLPIANDSIDVVLLHHLLDFVQSPQEVLKEVTRVTLPMGKVVITGFNPMSLWGIWQSAAQFRGKAPWTGQFIRTGRLMDWLNLLDFKIDRAQFAVYGLPSAKFPGGVTDYSQGVSRRPNLPVGAVYVIVAEKHIGGVRPIRPVWQRRPALGRLSVVRSIRHEGMKTVPTPDRSPLSNVEIFTDGACRGNPGPGGWGALLRAGDVEKELWGGETETTNNRMELLAAIKALEALTRPSSVSLTTDSQYVRKGITEWIKGWKAKGWKTASRQPVKNRDLWEKLDALSETHQIEWHWVKGHSGHTENERVDALANRGIDELLEE